MSWYQFFVVAFLLLYLPFPVTVIPSFSYARDNNLTETVQILEEFISESQHRLAFDDPNYHSFDDDDDDDGGNWNQNSLLN